MQDHDLSNFTLIAIHAALKAGEIIKRGFGTSFEISVKSGKQDFVTKYDKESEACIISIIKDKFPSHSFLAEESGLFQQGEESILWIIDPLDGTTNFTRHIPIITISIAAYQGESGLCGVIYQPFTQELFIAERGRGSYLNGTRLAVSQTDLIEDCMIVASLPHDAHSAPILNVDRLLQMSQRGATMRNFGSAALALAYVAAGKADAFLMYNLYPWDLAAGQLLIEEAGGLLTRVNNKVSPLHSPSNILATNQALHLALKEYLIF